MKEEINLTPPCVTLVSFLLSSITKHKNVFSKDKEIKYRKMLREKKNSNQYRKPAKNEKAKERISQLPFRHKRTQKKTVGIGRICPIPTENNTILTQAFFKIVLRLLFKFSLYRLVISRGKPLFVKVRRRGKS